MDPAAQVMARPGYTTAPRVFVIADNGSGHRGQVRADYAGLIRGPVSGTSKSRSRLIRIPPSGAFMTQLTVIQSDAITHG